ncbi:hypothetical protein CGZ94_20680 [Enemella evansiae]|uniref:Scaffolding protein n=1 Tax=Enemella evansiae TaxID=2016499 RepID=A0A255FW12_9ACTN|nr:hypothetical protein [Enemella evansiae]OYO07887.1 hypothetical protein CGZ94_20680 [Enemella evansiae]
MNDQTTQNQTEPTPASIEIPENGSTATNSEAVGDQGSPDQAEKDGPNAEAAKYRRRLREAETERDQLKDQVAALQRSAIEAVAVEMKLKPEALWAAGVDLAELVCDDGTIDRAKTTVAIETAGDKLGVWEARKKVTVPREGASPNPPRLDPFTAAFRSQQ